MVESPKVNLDNIKNDEKEIRSLSEKIIEKADNNQKIETELIDRLNSILDEINKKYFKDNDIPKIIAGVLFNCYSDIDKVLDKMSEENINFRECMNLGCKINVILEVDSKI